MLELHKETVSQGKHSQLLNTTAKYLALALEIKIVTNQLHLPPQALNFKELYRKQPNHKVLSQTETSHALTTINIVTTKEKQANCCVYLQPLH